MLSISEKSSRGTAECEEPDRSEHPPDRVSLYLVRFEHPVADAALVGDVARIRRVVAERHPRRLPRRASMASDASRSAFRRSQQDQTAVRRDRPAREIGGHLLALYGWKIEREKSTFGHGGRGFLVASGKSARKRIYTESNELRHARRHVLRP